MVKFSKQEQEDFNFWMKDGNVSKNSDGSYSTQDAQFGNKLKDMDALKEYYFKEFLSGSRYAGGGEIKVNGMTKMDYVIAYEKRVAKAIGDAKKEGVYFTENNESMFDSWDYIEEGSGFKANELVGWYIDFPNYLSSWLSNRFWDEKSTKLDIEVTKILGEFYFGKPMFVNISINTGSDLESVFEDELKKIKLLSNKIDFDEVKGNIESEQNENNTNLKFYKDGILVMNLKGDWNEETEELDSIIEIDGETVELNYHPLDSMGGLDNIQLKKNIDEALREINTYSAVVSIEGYEEYAEDVEGLENAREVMQDIKGNTRFQVLKGSSVGVGKLVDVSRVVEEFANGGEATFDVTKLDLDNSISSRVYYRGVDDEINKILQNDYKPVYDFDKKGIEWVYKNTRYESKDEDLIQELKEALAERNRGVVDMMRINKELPRIESKYGKDVNLSKRMYQKAKDFYQSKLRNEKSDKANEIFIDYLISRLKENKKDFANGGEVGKGYNVFNYTDNIYATDEVFKTKKLANDFIKEFRNRFSRQGYYRDNQMNKIAVEDIDLLAIPSDFNPFGKYADGGRTMENRAKKQARKDIKTHLYRPQAPYQSVEKPSEEWERYELPYDTKMQYDFEPDSLSVQDKRYSEFGKGGEVEYEIKRIVNEAKNQKKNTHFAIHKPTNSIVFTWDYSEYDTKELNAHKEDYFYFDVKDIVSGNVDKYLKSDFAIIQRKDLEKRGIDLNNYLVFVGQKYDKSESKNESDGGEAGFDDEGTSMVMYHEKRGNFITPKGQIYLWLYEGEKIGEKLQNQQYDWVFYPLTSINMAFQSGYIPPLKRVWTKKFQKEHKGSEHLLGLIKAYLIEKEGEKELFIDMMSVNPNNKKEGIMSYMIKDLRDSFNLSQDQVTFSKLTKEGEKFIAKKQYSDGGGVEPNIYFYNDGEQDITFTTFEQAYNEVQRLGYSKFRDNLGGEYFVNKDLTKKTIYQHKSNPYITLEFLEDTNKGIKGLQKNPKSLSKKERTDGIIVYYSDSEMKQLFDKKYSDGGGVEPYDEEKYSSEYDYLKKIITKNFGEKNTNYSSADWGGIDNWTIKGGMYEGVFIIIDDNRDVILMERKYNEELEENEDTDILYAEVNDKSALQKLFNMALQIKYPLNTYADGGETEEDKYGRGGFMYEVQKKGSPSNDMRETMFTAKNLTELKKKIIEKYGTSEGFLVSRRTEQGYYAPVKFEYGGGVGEFPPKGELTNKDNFLLKYEKKGSDYEFFVYKPITKEVSGYNQIKHVCLNKDCPQKMTYEQFINYLYVELYLDDNKYADGGSADGGQTSGLITDEQVKDLSFKIKIKNVPLQKGVLLHEIVTLEEFDLPDEENINFYPFHLIYGDSSLAIFDAFGVDEVAGLKRKDCEEFINNLKAQGKTEKDGSFIAGLTNYVGDKLFMFFNVGRLSYGGFANRVLPHEALHLSRSLISLLKNDWVRENLNTPKWWEDKRAVFVDMGDSNEEFFAETLERTNAIAMDGWYRVTGQKCVVEKNKTYADGGAIYPDLSLIKADVVNDSVVLDEFAIKKTKNTFTINGLENKKIKESSDIVRVLRSLWDKDTINAYEQSYVLYLNKSNNVIGYNHNSSGGIDGTIMDVQMISGMALKSLAKGVIIAHNHPSESTLPSDADKRITNQIKDALKVFNILLLDSIIITDESYFSFCDEGLI